MNFITLCKVLLENKPSAIEQMFGLIFQRYIDFPSQAPRQEDVDKFHKSLEEISINNAERQDLIKNFDLKLSELNDLSSAIENAQDEEKKDLKVSRDYLIKDIKELLKKF